MAAITFAIPFYRRRDYLLRAVDSVFAQSETDWRLVISDDAGPEGDVSASLPSDPRLTYVRQSANLGIAGNWNACLRLATTDLVTLLHADDELEPNYAATMLDAARRFPDASVYFCQARVIAADGRDVFSFPDWYKRWLLPARGQEFLLEGEDAVQAIYRGNFIMCPTMCYRVRDLPDDLFDRRWRQVLDLDMITRLLVAGRRFVGLPTIAYRYRRHEENQTKQLSDSLTRFEEERDLYHQTARQVASLGWTRAADVCRRMRIIRLNLLFCAVQDALRFRFSNALAKLRFIAALR